MEDERFEAFKRGFLRGSEAYRRGDVEASWAGVPEDFELLPPAEFPDRGPAEIAAYTHELRKEIPDWFGSPVEFINAGDGIYIVRLEFSGTSRSAKLPTAASVHQVWEVRDGVPIRAREFLDRDEAFRAAGLDGAPDAPD